jgi:hypothetical protein
MNHPDDPDTLHGHFLGSVVLHPALGAASTLMRHQVIDGQQRLTTILVLLAALRDARTEADPNWNPASIEDQYLRNPFSKEYPDRLIPTKLDRDAYVKTVRHRVPTGDVGIAYNYFRSSIEHAYARDQLDLARLENTLLLNMLLVEINTKTGDSINNIFNTLNSKGMDLSPADLVRNEVLHHIGETAADEAHEALWIPMEVALVNSRAKAPDREFVTFLWSLEVAINPKTSRDALFAAFERRLRSSLQALPAPERSGHALGALVEMHEDHRLFLIVRDPARGHSDGRISQDLLDALGALRDWRSEPATPIALWVLKQAVGGTVDQADAAEALNVLLSYLVKRTLNGIPTNQLNRLLTPVAFELSNRRPSVSLSEAMRGILSKQGYYWPTDDQVLSTVASNPIYASARRYVKFLLARAERRLPGHETANLSKSQIEHVMPQALSADWRQHLRSLGVELTDAEAVTHTLGNLTLTDNNQRMGNSLFSEKKRDFFVSSALRLNRDLATWDDWVPADVQERSIKLARLILGEFPHAPVPSSSQEGDDQSGASVRERLVSLLQSLPVGNWVTEDDLVAVLGVTPDVIRPLGNELDPTLARLVRRDDGSVPQWMSADLRAGVAEQATAEGELTTRIEADDLSDLMARSSDSDFAGEDEDAGASS